MNSFGTELRNSSDRRSFSSKTSIFLVFFVALPVRALQHRLLSLEQIRALHLIVKNGVTRLVVVFVRLTVVEIQACIVAHNFGNCAKFRHISASAKASARYIYSLYRCYRFHIWQLDRSNKGVAP